MQSRAHDVRRADGTTSGGRDGAVSRDRRCECAHRSLLHLAARFRERGVAVTVARDQGLEGALRLLSANRVFVALEGSQCSGVFEVRDVVEGRGGSSMVAVVDHGGALRPRVLYERDFVAAWRGSARGVPGAGWGTVVAAERVPDVRPGRIGRAALVVGGVA